jgi:uncharacterized lipoprotein YmbA
MRRRLRPARAVSLAACAAVALTALLLAGCGGERTIQPRFYVLTATAPPAIAEPAAGREPVTVGVGPVRLPAYLDRPQIVTRRAADEIEVAEFDRWGEPLADGVPRTIANDLSALLPQDSVAVFPWPAGRTIRYQVLVDVSRFDGAAGGDIVLDARWRVLGPDRHELVGRRSVIHEPTGGSGYTAVAAAMSRVLARLSREIAGALGSP